MTEKPLSINIEGNQILLWRNSDSSPLLPFCEGVIANEIFLLRSANHTTKEKCSILLQLAAQMHASLLNKGSDTIRSMRMSSYQLNTIEQEWGLIQSQHGALARIQKENCSGLKIAHLIFPSDYAYHRTDPRITSEFSRKSILHLQQQFNCEGWSVYCSWLNEDAEQVRKSFFPDAGDEYQLQGYLENFSHQVNSIILRDIQSEINAATLEEEAEPVGESDKLYSLEQRIVAGRAHLRPLLEVQSSLLDDIADGISKIEAMHPVLIPLRIKAYLLHLLISNQMADPKKSWSWGKQLLLMHLLDEYLGVVPAISCDTGVERTNLVFCIRLALAELKKRHSPPTILALCLGWDDLVSKLQPVRDELRTSVLSNLLTLGIKGREGLVSEILERPWGPNFDVLSFLPTVFKESKAIRSTTIKVLEHDPQTGKVLGCTAEGRDLLRRLAVL